MKKRVGALTLALVMSVVLAIPAGASTADPMEVTIGTVSGEEAIINDADFVVNASVEKRELGNDFYEFNLVNQEEVPVSARTSDIVCQSAKIIATSEEEAALVEANIQQAKRIQTRDTVGDTLSGTYFGGSIYMESTLRIHYDATLNGYKLLKLETNVSTSNGAAYRDRKVKLVAGSRTTTINITASSSYYNAEAPSTWGHIQKTSTADIGGEFSLTAVRASGDSQKCTLRNYYF